MPYIRETIITTVDAAGTVHIAPLGIIEEDGSWVIAPFRPSKTLDNLAATGVAVANLTDDPLVFAGCLTGRKDFALAAIEGYPVPRLEAALAHDVLVVESVAEDETRPRYRCRIAASATHAPFTGLNRARAAIVEAAILVSRLHMLPAEKIEAEIAYLNIAIEKTAGERERQAWYWLMERVIAHLASLEA